MNKSEDRQYLKVFYDGACVICSREIEHYRKQPVREKIIWIDISDHDFSAQGYGLDPKEVEKRFHAIIGDQVFSGVDAFMQIWKRIPRYQFLAKIAVFPIVKPILNIGYAGFSKIRPFLPKKNHDCERCVR